jgi:hypothetical protein
MNGRKKSTGASPFRSFAQCVQKLTEVPTHDSALIRFGHIGEDFPKST